MPSQSDSGSTLLTTNNETVLSTVTTVGLYEFAIDLNPLTGGTTPDVLLIYPKEKVLSGSTARIVDGFPFNYVGGLVASPVAKYQILVMHSVAFAIQQTQGTLRTFDWSVRKVDNVTIEANNDKTGYTLSTTGMNNLLDLTDSIETGLTFRNALRAMAAALAGKISGGATTTITIRNAVADSKNRIIATVDSNGNRSAITYDFS